MKTLTAPIGLSSFFTIVFDLCILIYLHICITDYIRELLLFFRCLSTSCNIASRGFTPSYTALVILLKLYPLVVLSMYDVYVLHVCILFYACLTWYLKLALARSRVLIEVGRGRTLSWKRLPRPLVFFFFIIIFDVFKLIYIHVYITDYTRELLLFFRCLSTSCNTVTL